MADNLNNNPFSALFPTVEEAKVFSQEIKPQIVANLQQKSSKGCDREKDVQEQIESTINNIIESIFLITINNGLSSSPKCPSHCIYLQELHDVLHGQNALDLNILEQAVFERLMLENPRDFLSVLRENSSSSHAEEDAVMDQNFHYLYLSFYRCKKLETQYQENFRNVIQKCQSVVISNSRMMLCHPEIYEKQNSAQQFVDLFLEYYTVSGHNDTVLEFLDLVVLDSETALQNGDDDITLEDMFQPILNLLLEKFRSFTLVDTSLFRHLPILHFFSRKPNSAKVLIDFSMPKQAVMGKAFETTLLGCILHISCLPSSELGPFEFFDQPSRYSQQEHSITEKNLWTPISSLNNEVFEIVFRILKMSSPVRHLMLKWIGNCLQANSGRAKLWTHIQTLLNTEVSDAFVLNLGGVLLRLSKPFSEPRSPKLLKIDPTYCAAIISNEDEVMQKGIYLSDLHKETTLLPSSDDDKRFFSNSYNFTTTCFFLTHRCLNLGFQAVHERFLKLNQELARTQRLYEEARGQAGESSEAVQNIKNVMERGMSQFLSIKTVLLEPNNLELALNFHVSSATWLIHLASSSNLNEFQPIKFPLPEQASHFLTYIPEFIVDGIADFIIFLRRFSPRTLELCGENLGHLMTFILVFMGDQNRIKNPHLRAKLAEMLESLIPHQDDKPFAPIASSFHRTRLFQEHPHIKYLAPTLLNVFVSIEMTGQSVAFEQKFKYRRPMYIVMDYLWDFELHKQAFKVLAEEAEQNMESTQPPLFLRFINLLINDAIFLLDEALLYMTQLREQQQLRESGELQNLPTEQRQQNEANFQQMGLLARFHNVMGNSTIHVLELVTREIRSIFSHHTMVDRIAAMLNYFLLHLVGPKKKQLKVKDLTEYEFKPQELVRDICRIYLHLGDSEKFCLAVSQDGRSYSPELFDLAQNVLQKIGQASLISDLIQLANNVKEMAAQQQAEDEALGEIPEEFLDPIMGTLMSDPVLLPSSKVTVDRATIARHLLSDQTDPFNRSPLTMDQVIPDEDKKKQLQQWLDSHSNVKINKRSESKNNNIGSEDSLFDS